MLQGFILDSCPVRWTERQGTTMAHTRTTNLAMVIEINNISKTKDLSIRGACQFAYSKHAVHSQVHLTSAIAVQGV